MEDLGAPSSYLALERGTAVFASGGERIGAVTDVVDAPDADIFDGLYFESESGRRYAEGAIVDEIFERGVVLTVAADAVPGLPEPRS